MTELIPALLDKVDDGSKGFTPAVQLSYLKKKEQQEIIDAMEATQCTPSLSQAIRMRDYQIVKQNVESFYAAQQSWDIEEDMKKKRQQER